MAEKLNPCPFCGKTETVKVLNSNKIDCLEESDSGYDDAPFYKGVCDFVAGGCGASGGYRETQEQAITAWNTRT